MGFVRYIIEPVICLNRVASTNSDEVSTKSFNFVSMGVYMDLHFNMSTLFNFNCILPLVKEDLLCDLPNFKT
jgi:hypothetical protein